MKVAAFDPAPIVRLSSLPNRVGDRYNSGISRARDHFRFLAVFTAVVRTGITDSED